MSLSMKTISCSWPWDPEPPGISVISTGEDAQLKFGVPGLAPVDEDVDACNLGVGTIENKNRNDHWMQAVAKSPTYSSGLTA